MRDLSQAATTWEQDLWMRRGWTRGWVRLSDKLLGRDELPAVAARDAFAVPPRRHLILLHDAFSTSQTTFSGWASSQSSGVDKFWADVAKIYDDRVFGFNHFTVSATPEENALELLQSLPDEPHLCDIVAFSRGGLVAQVLVSGCGELQSLSRRLQIGRVALIGTPSQGIPLFAPTRFQAVLGWLGTIVDCFEQNPFAAAVDLIAEALYWQANQLAGIPCGLSAMANDSTTLTMLRQVGAPPCDYWTLAASHTPSKKFGARLSDLGIADALGTPNDIFVGTESASYPAHLRARDPINSHRELLGVNGDSASDKVHHGNLLAQPTTLSFLLRALVANAESEVNALPDTPILLPKAGPLDTSTIDEFPAGVRQPPSVTATPAVIPGNTQSRGPFMAGKEFSGDSFTDDVFLLSVLAVDPNDHHDFQLLATFRNARVLEKLKARGDEAGQRWQHIIAVQEGIRSFLNGKPGAIPPPEGDALMELGSSLFETLFPGEVRRLYDIARASQPTGRLNIIFTSMVSWIADKPWEFAYDPARRTFLATEDANFVRNVHTAVPADRLGPREGPLKILVVVAQPLALPGLSVEQEVEVVKAGFKTLIDDHLAEVDVLAKASPEDLHRKLLTTPRQYDVLHFIGHGVYDEQKGSGYLAFEAENGALQLVDAATLRLIIARRGIRLVFLNACETGRGGRADFNRGAAPALVTGGVPAVVANQYSVLDSSATTFSRLFYWALAQGYSLGDAMREARICLSYSIGSDVIDWAIPVLFARNPNDQLCIPSRAAILDPITARESVRRQTPRSATVRIALWDVQAALPQLTEVADKLNSVQATFFFAPVSFSAPLGTWQRVSEGGILYLCAEQVAARLKDKPAQLGTDRMLAFTTFPLKSDDTLDLSYWANDSNTIAINSLAGLLDQLTPPATSLERLIVNACVTFAGGLDTHEVGPKDCVFYYNDERDIRWAAGPLNICQTDRDAFKAAGVNVDSLDCLLATYP